jgi:hypothetical protein
MKQPEPSRWNSSKKIWRRFTKKRRERISFQTPRVRANETIFENTGSRTILEISSVSLVMEGGLITPKKESRKDSKHFSCKNEVSSLPGWFKFPFNIDLPHLDCENNSLQSDFPSALT